MRLQYSSRAAKAIGVLKKPYNNLEIYVEDTSSQNMWLRILQAVIPRTIKLRSVNMLGGREQVLAACRLDQKDDGRKRIYIIDGDFDFLRGKGKPRLKYLYRLRAYCAENLLISNDNIADVALDCTSTTSLKEITGKTDLEGEILKPISALRNLFVVYATAFELKSGQKTVGFSVQNLLTSSPSSVQLCELKIRKRYIDVLRTLCRSHTVDVVRSKRKAIARNAKSLNLHQVVSGKDYILPVVLLHLKRTYGYKGTVDQLRGRLSKNFSPTMEPYLARRLLELAA